MTSTNLELLTEHPFVDGLTPTQLSRLSPWVHRALFPAGTQIFHPGGRADRFWLIRSGEVQISTEVDGADVPIEQIGPGTVLGWSWLVPPQRWHFTARAISDVHAVQVDADGIHRVCSEDPAIGYELTRRMAQVLAERLQATQQHLVTRTAG